MTKQLLDTKHTLVDNNFLARWNRYYKGMMNYVEERTIDLHTTLTTTWFSTIIKEAGRYAGRRPGWHIETGLLNRFKNAGLNGFVRQFDPIDQTQFDATLKVAETLMAENPKFTGDHRRLGAATLRASKACKFPNTKFKPTSIEYAAEHQLNKSSSSGYPFFQKKGKVLSELISQAQTLLQNKADYIWNWPCTRGFRLQLRESLNTLSRKIRIMYPYPGSIILLEDTFIMPFVDHFIQTDTFYVIGQNGEKIGNKINNRFNKRLKRITSADISKFDQSLLNEVIISSFFILRNQLQLTQNESISFDKIVSYFCTSIMVSKSKGAPPYAFVKTHGVPSGSGFTNMIDSIAHAIMVEYLYPGLLDQCLICGDDNLFDSSHVDIKYYFEEFKTVFNMTIDPVKTDHFSTYKSIYFLGFKWINCVRYISPLLALNQVLWHADFLTSLDVYERELARSASVLLNGKNGKDYFTRLFPDVVTQLNQGKDIRYLYLYGTAPPTTHPGVSGVFNSKIKTVAQAPGSFESLKLHMDYGYLIR